MILASRKLGPGRLQPTDKGYVATWTDACGKRRRRILSSDKRVAERAFAALIRDRDLASMGLLQEHGLERRLSELRERYLAELGSYAKPDHVRRLTHVTAKMIEALGDVAVRDLRVDAMLAFRQRRLKQGAGVRTANLEVGGFRTMLAWAVRIGLIPLSPIANLKPLPAGKAHERHPRRALTRNEIDALLHAADGIDERVAARWTAQHSIARWGRGAAHRDRPRRPHVPQAPLWRALLWTGARWGELTAVRWGDMVNGTFRLRPETTKSKKQRLIPLLDVVAADLERLRDVQRVLLGRDPRPDEHVFLGPRGKPVRQSYRRALYRFRELLAEAQIPGIDELGRKVDIHALRHSFASELGRAGVGLTQAQALLGHSDPRLTSAIYTHLGVEDLRGAVERLQAGRAGAARTA